MYGLHPYGWYRESDGEILHFDGTLTEGNYSDGFTDWATTKIKLTQLERQ